MLPEDNNTPNDFIDFLFAEEDNTTAELVDLYSILDDIPKWVEHEFDIELRPFQTNILSCDNKKIVMRIARRQGKCLHEDTAVMLANGETRPIKDINKGDWVISTYDQSVCPRQVKEKHDNGIQFCHIVKTKTGREIICTADHRLLKQFSNNPRWTKLKNISVGNKIAILGSAPCFGNEKLLEDHVTGSIPKNYNKLNKINSEAALSDYVYHHHHKIIIQSIGYKIACDSEYEKNALELLLLRAGIFPIIQQKDKSDTIYLSIKDYSSVKKSIKLFGLPITLPAHNYIDRTNDVIWDEIISIKEFGNVQTYDLEIDTYKHKDKNFIGNGVIVHNSFVMLLKVLHFCMTHANAAVFWIAQAESIIQEIFEIKLNDVLSRSLRPHIEASIQRRTKKPCTITFGNGTIIRTAIAGKGSTGEAVRGLGQRLSGTGRVCKARVLKVSGYNVVIKVIEKAEDDITYKERDIFFDHYIKDQENKKIRIDSSTARGSDGSIGLKLAGKPKLLLDDEIWIRVETVQGDVLIVLDEMEILSERSLVALIPIIQESKTVEVWGASTPAAGPSTFKRWCKSPVINKKTGLNALGFVHFHYPQWEIDPLWIVRDENTGEALLDENGEILTREQELRSHLSPIDYTREVGADWGDDEEGAYSKHKIDECFRGPSSNYLYSNIIDPDSPMRTMGVDWNKFGAGPEMVIIQMHPETKILYIVARYQMPAATSENDLVYTSAVQMVDQLAQIYRPHHIYVDRGAGEQQVETLLQMAEKPGKGYLRVMQGKNFGSTIEVLNYWEKTWDKARLKSVMIDNLSKILDHNLIIGRDDKANLIDVVNVEEGHYIKPPNLRHMTQSFVVSLPEELEAVRVKGKDTKGYSFESQIEDHGHDALLLAVQAVFENHDDYKNSKPVGRISLNTMPVAEIAYKEYSKSLCRAIDEIGEGKTQISIIPVKSIKPRRGRGRTAFGSKNRPSRVYWR